MQAHDEPGLVKVFHTGNEVKQASPGGTPKKHDQPEQEKKREWKIKVMVLRRIMAQGFGGVLIIVFRRSDEKCGKTSYDPQQCQNRQPAKIEQITIEELLHYLFPAIGIELPY